MAGTSAVIGKATDNARNTTRTSDNENLRSNKLVFHTPGQARRDKGVSYKTCEATFNSGYPNIPEDIDDLSKTPESVCGKRAGSENSDIQQKNKLQLSRHNSGLYGGPIDPRIPQSSRRLSSGTVPPNPRQIQEQGSFLAISPTTSSAKNQNQPSMLPNARNCCVSCTQLADPRSPKQAQNQSRSQKPARTTPIHKPAPLPPRGRVKNLKRRDNFEDQSPRGLLPCQRVCDSPIQNSVATYPHERCT